MIDLPHLSLSIDPQDDFSRVVLVTFLWILTLNTFAVNQALTIPDLKDPASRLDYTDKAWVLADRSFLNLVEQTPIFLTILWMHSIIIGPDIPGTLGLISVVCRVAYPILRNFSFYFIGPTNMTYYLCCQAMQINVLSKLFTGDVVTTTLPSNALKLFGYAALLHVFQGLLAVALKTTLAALRGGSGNAKKEDEKKN